MDKLLSIGEAAEWLGVSPMTPRRWEASGKLTPERTAGNQRRYRLSQIDPAATLQPTPERKTLAYARVSSHDQKDDLERQKQVLELYCAQQGWIFELISDLGSGMNYYKKGLKRLCVRLLRVKLGGWSSPTKTACYALGQSWCFPSAKPNKWRW